MKKKYRISIIGLGYVGLPLAIEFAKKYQTIGYDINKNRITELINNIDSTLEVNSEKLKSLKFDELTSLKSNQNGFFPTNKLSHLKDSNIFIVTVPTPIDKNKQPNLEPLIFASKDIGSLLKKDDIVIYESTVYPGVTEEKCVPTLEKYSQLKLNKDFFVGYSPERINPGDKKRPLTKILKVTSGSSTNSAKEIDNLYKEIITAGTYLAPSIKVAEASKVIENSQRDINIAFVNELAKIFNLLNIDTNEVIKAASTKWNFLPFQPGLVGGHCIGIDPYYLAQKSQELGYIPDIILSGRRLNDSMGIYVANRLIKYLIINSISIKKSKILILGITFKENCPDIRNTKVVDIINKLKEFTIEVDVFDPQANSQEVYNNYDISIIEKPLKNNYDAVILAVAHNEFLEIDFKKIMKKKSFIFDLKGFLSNADYRL